MIPIINSNIPSLLLTRANVYVYRQRMQGLFIAIEAEHLLVSVS